MRELLSNFIIYGLGSILSKFIGFLLLPIFTARLTPAEYGYYDLILSITVIVAIFGMLQLETGFQQFYYKQNNEKEKSNLLSTLLYCVVCFSLIVVLVYVLFVPTISKIWFADGYLKELYIASIEILFSNMFTFLLLVLRFDNKPKLYSLIVFVNSLIYALISILLVLYFNLGVMGVLLGSIISNACAISSMVIIERHRLIWTFDFSLLKEVTKFTIPILPARLGSVANTYINRFLMITMFSAEMIGLYSIGIRMASIVYLVQTAFQLSWVPYLYKILEKPGHKEIIQRTFMQCTLLIFFAVTLMTLFSRELILIVSNTQYLGACAIVGLLCLYNGMALIKETVEIGMKVKGKSLSITYSYFIAFFVNLAGLTFLPLYFGIVGVALSLLLSNIVLVYVTIYFSNKLYPIEFPLKKFSLLIFATVMMSICMPNMDLSIMLKFIIASVAVGTYIIYNRNFVNKIIMMFVNKQERARQ